VDLEAEPDCRIVAVVDGRSDVDRPPGYDLRMCSHEEWERFARRFRDAVDDGQLREFVETTLIRIEAFAEELASRACASEDASWVRGCGRRSGTEWVA
jgi:hypothetical protein